MKMSKLCFDVAQSCAFGLSAILIWPIIFSGCNRQEYKQGLGSTGMSRYQIEVEQSEAFPEGFGKVDSSNVKIEKFYVNVEELAIAVDDTDFPITIHQHHFDLLNPSSELKGSLLGSIVVKAAQGIRLRGKLGSSAAGILDGEHRSIAIRNSNFDLSIDKKFALPKADEVMLIKLKIGIQSVTEVGSGGSIEVVPEISFQLAPPEVDATRLNQRIVGKERSVGSGKNRQQVEVRSDGSWIIEGDILVGQEGSGLNERFKAYDSVHEGIRRIDKVKWAWPGGIVPYTFDSSVNSAQQSQIVAAMSHWTSLVPQLQFRLRTSEPNYIIFVTGSVGTGCYSSVGMVGGGQVINLATGCYGANAVIWHEIAHALGVWHEQSRSDRDSKVTINFGNILPGKEHNFAKRLATYSDEQGRGEDIGAYDYDSVMHYGPYDFSVNGQKTIDAPFPIGQRSYLSSGDVATVASLYTTVPVDPTVQCSCTGQGGVSGVTFWGIAGQNCSGLSAWGKHENDCRPSSTRTCKCTGQGGVSGVALWGPEGRPCGGFGNWGTYSNDCRTVNSTTIGKCKGYGGVSGLDLYGPIGATCGDQTSWGNYVGPGGSRMCSCVGKGGVNGLLLWGRESNYCAGISSWGTHSTNCQPESKRVCSCTGQGGVSGLKLWGPEGEPCAGISSWGTYSQNCKSRATVNIGTCIGHGGVQGLTLYGPAQVEYCAGIQSWGVYQ